MKKFLATSLFLFVAAVAQAAPIGTVTLGICDGTGQGVTVTATTIDFTQPVGGGFGCTQTASGTNLTFTGGTLLSGIEGELNDLNSADPSSFLGFLTFPAIYPNLSFSLTSIGPGLADTTCEDSVSSSSACSFFAGSPFIVRGNEANTTVTLAVRGTATDGDGLSSFVGSFSTEFDGTPFQLQQTFNTQGQLTAGYSARITASVSAIPEPGTYAMLLSGGLLVGLSALRRRSKKA